MAPIKAITLATFAWLTGTLSCFCITPSAAIERMYGMMLVTTAKFTNASNCLLSEGLMVIKLNTV
ncbi:Uncharacterised protein [Vibrio cholerae]|uniref:Uncharacterized protein n=1 Tax=Vibrio cholerae TaxID=666 RepID=A0A655NSD9_VIBCL|nr:Uncharacterised protein [Vibrio cholerae]CSA31804.1 Uncharacterised protein [Vibrio cholerae]CSC92100.1 Uncharacterised protein [Vibrio cholerae]